MSSNMQIQLGEDSELTVKDTIVLSGISFYSKKKVKAIIKPAGADTGIVFKKGDRLIPAISESIKFREDSHTTSLQKGVVTIKTIEHLMSALWGMGVDNAIIVLDEGAQIPFRDASSKYYTGEIKKVGVKTLKKKRKYLIFKKEVRFIESKDDDRYAVFKPSSGLCITSTTSFPAPIDTKTVRFTWNPEIYENDISWARSFLRAPLDDDGLLWQKLRKKFGLLPEDPIDSPVLTYNRDSFITKLLKQDEPARHKLLDFIGDIALLGVRIKADVEVYKPGHRFTRKIVRDITKELK